MKKQLHNTGSKNQSIMIIIIDQLSFFYTKTLKHIHHGVNLQNYIWRAQH